jgi:SAM-dependent methyltransferase
MQSAQFELHATIEQQHWWFVARRRIMRALVEQVLPPGQGLVVDVGCGTGGNLAALAGDYRCVGIDTSAEAIELARQRFPGVQFLCGLAPDDLGHLAAEAKCFLLMDVLEHVPDDRGLFSRLVQAASPGACFLVTVPAGPELWSPHDESFGHYRRYDFERLSQLWTGLPLELLGQSYFNARLYPAVRAVRSLNQWRGRTAGQAGTDFSLPPKLVNRTLEGLFAGEARRLKSVVQGTASGYRRGVSLVAMLRREVGPVPLENLSRVEELIAAVL